jgi:serine/threonine protein kinase
MTKSKREIDISKIIMENPHENIVEIYQIHESSPNNHIDMELLDRNLEKYNIEDIRKTMENVKTFLQGIGIMYIDWKSDNIGIDSNGNLKLFDFDASGKINIGEKEWKNVWAIKPPTYYYSYRKSIEAGYILPKDIDNYSFCLGFKPSQIKNTQII